MEEQTKEKLLSILNSLDEHQLHQVGRLSYDLANQKMKEVNDKYWQVTVGDKFIERFPSENFLEAVNFMCENIQKEAKKAAKKGGEEIYAKIGDVYVIPKR